MTRERPTDTGPRATEMLSMVALVIAALLLAVAWSDGRPPSPCEGEAAKNAGLLLPAIFASAVAALISLVGAATARGRRGWFAGATLLAAIGLGVAAALSIPHLIPCLGE
jgi:hypothetical protein